jgi:alkylhydroperoxidase family enzyme
MARIPYVDPDDPNLDPAIRAFMVRPGAASADVVNVVRALANNGRALTALGQLSRVGDQITKSQRELAYLTTSLLNNCHY